MTGKVYTLSLPFLSHPRHLAGSSSSILPEEQPIMKTAPILIALVAALAALPAARAGRLAQRETRKMSLAPVLDDAQRLFTTAATRPLTR